VSRFTWRGKSFRVTLQMLQFGFLWQLPAPAASTVSGNGDEGSLGLDLTLALAVPHKVLSHSHWWGNEEQTGAEPA